MAYDAKIVLDSISEAGDRLTTMEVTFPRFVLAEFNTHRAFSRNSASSRAIPFEKQLARIRQDPFIPIYWGKNQSGMQAEGEISETKRVLAIEDWLKARDYAVAQALELHHEGVHKQTVNRLLEPFMWHTVIVTATEWSNFFALRANPDAQPEIRVIAEKMQSLHESSEPLLLSEGEWHLPYIRKDELRQRKWANSPEVVRMVSAARCGRVSYLTHDGRRSFRADVKLYARLAGGGHMSPLEHVATPYQIDVECGGGVEHEYKAVSGGFSGNFRGWKQLRKFVPNEDDFSKIRKG